MRLAVRADSLDCIAAPDMPAAGPSSGHCIPVAITSISSVCMAIVGLPAPVCVPFALFWEEPKRVWSSYGVSGAESYRVMSTSRSWTTPGRMSAFRRSARACFCCEEALLGGGMKRRAGGSSYDDCCGGGT